MSGLDYPKLYHSFKYENPISEYGIPLESHLTQFTNLSLYTKHISRLLRSWKDVKVCISGVRIGTVLCVTLSTRVSTWAQWNEKRNESNLKCK